MYMGMGVGMGMCMGMGVGMGMCMGMGVCIGIGTVVWARHGIEKAHVNALVKAIFIIFMQIL